MKYRNTHYTPASARTVIQTGGFTIVELLVVVVVIGILAAITIVSYASINQKAVLASLQSDLSNAAKKLKLYQTDNGYFPTTMTLSGGMYCPSPADARYCVKTSSTNVLAYTPGNGANPQTYVLTANYNSINYTITNTSKPIATAPNNPVADWLAVEQGDHYGNYYDLVGKQWGTVTRSGVKTIFDPGAQKIYDVPANFLAVNPRSDTNSGSEAIIEDTRINYGLNSDGENTLGSPSWYNNNWGGSTAVVSQETSSMVHGSKSVKFETTNWVDNSFSLIPYNNAVTPTIPMTGGLTYTFSIWGKVLSGSASYRLDFQDTNSTATSVANLTSSWQRFSVTKTLAAGVTNIVLRVYALGGNQSSLWDATQIELGAFPTSYIPTTTTTVTRNADIVTIPTTGWTNPQGAFVAVAKTDPSSQGALGNYLLQWYDSGSSRLGLTFANTVQSHLNYYNGSGGPDAYKNRALAKEYTTQAVSWVQNGTWSCYVNGGTGQDWTPVGTFTLTSPTAYIGNDHSGGGSANMMNGPIQRLAIYPNSLSSSIINVVTNAIKDGP